MTDWLLLAVKISLGGACVLAVAAYVCSLLITSYSTYDTACLSAAELGIEATPFGVTAAEDAELRGLFVTGDRSLPVIIASHGIADCKEGVLPFLLPYIRAGYGIAVYDMRHHNESSGRHCTLGCFETDDLCRVTRHVRTALAEGRPLVYWGFSLGATVSLLAAARENGIAAVVAHCPFPSVRAVVAHYVREFYHIPSWPLVPVALYFMQLRTGARVDDVNVFDAAPRLHRTPVLLFGSTQDRQVPVFWLKELADAIGPSATLVIGPYGHGDGMIAEEEGLYDEGDVHRTLDFLARHARRATGSQP